MSVYNEKEDVRLDFGQPSADLDFGQPRADLDFQLDDVWYILIDADDFQLQDADDNFLYSSG